MPAVLSAPSPGGPPSRPTTTPKARTSRRSLLGVGLGVAGLVLAIAVWSQPSSTGVGGDLELRPTEHVDRVELSVESGSIEIVTGDEFLIDGSLPERSRSNVTLDHEVIDGRWEVQVSCSWLTFQWRCAAPVRLVVPAGTPVTAATRAGAITASGLTGGVDLRTEAGTIDVHDLEGNIRLASEAGSLRGTVRRGTLDASTSAGGITITVLDDLSRLSASTEVGPIDLVVPDAAYDITASTTIGRTDVALESTSGASRTIDARSEVGSVTIRPGTRSSDDS